MSQVTTCRTEDDVRSYVRTALAREGMTQRQFAEDLGISQKHLSQMLTGKAGITIPMLFRMLRILDPILIFRGPDAGGL